MAFKMRGNPFPKKGGSSFKQDDEETDLSTQFVDFQKLYQEGVTGEQTAVSDSLQVVEDKLLKKLTNAQKLWDEGDINRIDYKNIIDEYNQFINYTDEEGINIEGERGKTQDIRNEQINKKFQEMMNIKGDSLQSLAFDKHLKSFNEGKITKNELNKIIGDTFMENISFSEE